MTLKYIIWIVDFIFVHSPFSFHPKYDQSKSLSPSSLHCLDSWTRSWLLGQHNCVWFKVSSSKTKPEHHLFYGCNYSRHVCDALLFRCSIQYRCSRWKQEVEEATRRFKGSSLGARCGLIAFSITVYCPWRERNYRAFRRVVRTPGGV